MLTHLQGMQRTFTLEISRKEVWLVVPLLPITVVVPREAYCQMQGQRLQPQTLTVQTVGLLIAPTQVLH
jgi:hypothetical protein